jgi:hypothetical protein
MTLSMTKLQPTSFPVMMRARQVWKTGFEASCPGYAPAGGVRPDVAETTAASNVSWRLAGVTFGAARWFSSIPLWFLKTPSAELIFGVVSGSGDCRFVWQ